MMTQVWPSKNLFPEPQYKDFPVHKPKVFATFLIFDRVMNLKLCWTQQTKGVQVFTGGEESWKTLLGQAKSKQSNLSSHAPSWTQDLLIL